jgi:hypothetical protein
MATPKEQHDARPNARSMGRVNHRRPPADAVIRAPGASDDRPGDVAAENARADAHAEDPPAGRR